MNRSIRSVCVPCRIVDLPCSCTEPRTIVSGFWAPPKRNDDRAWKRIEKGEWKWDRRRVKRVSTRGGRKNDTYTTYEYRKVFLDDDDSTCDHECCNLYRQPYRLERVPGSGRERTNFNRLPDVDLGG